MTIPLPLRRSLLASLLIPVSLSFSASAADFIVDAAQTSDPAHNIYTTLDDLARSGSLAAGDTVVLNNDDASLTTGLTVPVNFRSDDPDTPRTVDLSGLGKNPMYDLAEGEYALDMDSVIWSNSPIWVMKIQGDNSTLTFGNNAVFSFNVIDIMNTSTNGLGSVVYMRGDHSVLTFGDNASFSGNMSYALNTPGRGGAISMSGNDSMMAFGDHASFSDNRIQIIDPAPFSGAGGAISMSGSRSILTFGNHASFSRNIIFFSNTNITTSSYGGAISMIRSDSILTFGDHASFSNNGISFNFSYTNTPSSNYGGAISMHGSDSILTFGGHASFFNNGIGLNSSYTNTTTSSFGGAISMSGSDSILTFGNHASFSGNYAYGSSDGAGGAIYMQGNNISLTIRNGASFTNNYAFVNGGAIFLDGNNTDKFSRFLAFTHDVFFSGNMTGGTFTQHDDGSFSVENGIANAIHVYGTSHLQLAAAQGREVRFNDPITSSTYGIIKENVTLSLNQYTDDDGISHATDGTVIFSGELYQGDDAHLVASRYSDFKGQTTLYGGTLILEHNVVFGNSQLRDDTSMTLEHGTLEITGSSVINAASFTIANGDAVLRPGTSAFINAKDVDLSRGFVFDMQKQAQEAASLANTNGLSISASGSFTLGGSIGIMDTGISADYFYADNSWEQQRTFIILTDANQTHTDDFSGAHSLATGSDRVDSPYAYTGSWSHQWVDADGDGFPEQLQLVWTPDEEAAIRDILPELAGTLAMNSMWSSSANALGMSRAALGHLDAMRFIAGPENNYWVKGMGDFLNHASEGARDGFDYHGGGYSVGADRKITSHTILGLGFGDLYGKMNGRHFAGDIDQQTRTGMLYGGWHKVLNRKNTLLVTGTAGYGWTDNKMNSFHTGGRSHGKWTNETLFGTLTGKWSRRVDETVAMDFMLGLEYTDVTQEAFTETGWDARRFEKGRLKNLSVPVGVGLTHRSELKGREWINSAMVSYVPDVYRENPGAQAERLLNGYRWEAQGTSPDRNAVRVNVNSALQLNARWRTYAGYEFEGRSKATAHRFNAGVSYAY
ncbi:autotransporter outer membrane beta-barrel domain-containing protein [Akkermansia muciniphila]|uniref:autotransporter outer membrane beta-barrel domain-containing protein n=1 Tax=Akkermansia muciniphila TaxID=239935 RepID=UPI0033AFEAAA